MLQLKRELNLTNGDPLSAEYTITQNMRLGREGWWTNSDIVVTQTADEEYFYLKGYMDVTANEEKAFHKVWDQKIKRFGM